MLDLSASNSFSVFSVFETIGWELGKRALKRVLSGLRQYLAKEKLLKMMKNTFYFTLKSLFFLKIIRFLS